MVIISPARGFVKGFLEIAICSNITFVPPAGVQPIPPNPGNPSVSISGTGPWVVKVSSPNAGQWKLQFKVTVTYDVLDKKTGDKKPNEKFGPYEGIAECTFKATTSSFKIEIKPDDNFNGNRTKLGIGEPANVVVSKWNPTDTVVFHSMKGAGNNNAPTPSNTLLGVSYVAFETDPSFDAGHYSGSATLTVRALVNGSSTPSEDTISVTVVEPSGLAMIQFPNTYKWHVNNTASVGFLGMTYYLPNDVSFWKVKFREGTCSGIGTGYFLYANGTTHDEVVDEWFDCVKGISPMSKVPNTEVTYDDISSGEYNPPFTDGTFTWAIPQYFKIGTHEGTVSALNQVLVINASGELSISKGGITKSAKFGDRDSTSWMGPDQ